MYLFTRDQTSLALIHAKNKDHLKDGDSLIVNHIAAENYKKVYTVFYIGFVILKIGIKQN